DGAAAEVFGTYSRGQRIRAIAARIAFDGQRWRVVALQIG
ncbi:Rv3235 family protein, partial [Mycobacterium sp. E136]